MNPEDFKELQNVPAGKKTKQRKPASEQQHADLEREAKIASVIDPAFGASIMLPWLLERKQSADFILPLQKTVANVVASGDSKAIEEMLYAQSLSLQALFNRWISVAALCTEAESIDRLGSLALRAQDQGRKTLLALSEVRNPKKPTQFIKNYVDKQLNQLRVDQVEPTTTDPSSLEESKNAPVDIRSQSQASRVNQELEALGIEYGTNDS
ncbi:hypothetical protein H6F90_29660 [Trichocoleus sp. FACHB-591]|uniref:hypothetical protein n=1 Tax=Trichocoleus sp. FACHB-591 TaxID=2692872 RepID=UPI00168349C1|nr:hypothetical protein [Trichocoleus sp. FACHB-591]MBD2099234.1 hypothetical protein [Trichocoleus sp. FACHB-591]